MTSKIQPKKRAVRPPALHKPANIRQVAEQAGVSIATVSRVLAGGENVSAEAIERVRAAALSLNYQPNRIARSLRRQRTSTAALVVTDIENPFFTTVLRGVEQVLRLAGYALLLTYSDENEQNEKQHLLNLRAEGVAGVILAPTSRDMDFYNQLTQSGMVMVAIDRCPDKLRIDRVTVNNISGVRAAVEHLVELGHTRIGFISGLHRISTAAERYEGFEQGMKSHKLPVQPGWVQDGNFRREGGYAAMLNILKQDNRPSAVICSNNMMSLGALQAIYDSKLHIPDDISIVGFDDMPWATALHPPLTVIAQPINEMGVVAAQLLLDRIQNPAHSLRHVILDTHLIVRESSSRPTQS